MSQTALEIYAGKGNRIYNWSSDSMGAEFRMELGLELEMLLAGRLNMVSSRGAEGLLASRNPGSVRYRAKEGDGEVLVEKKAHRKAGERFFLDDYRIKITAQGTDSDKVAKEIETMFFNRFMYPQ